MKKPLFVGSSDWHLEKNAWIRYPELAGDSYFGLQQIVQICLEHKAHLLAAGDLFDKQHPDAYSVSVAMNSMERMKQEKLNVFFTQGQHEYSKLPWLGLHEWPVWLDHKSPHGILYDLDGYLIAGFDYTKPAGLKAAVEPFHSLGYRNLHQINIMMCHQVWSNFMGTIRTTDGDLSMLPPVNLILTGDYHRHLTAHVPCRSSNSYINTALSAGSTCMQSIDEPADKYVYLIYDDFSFESIKLKSRQVFYQVLNNNDDLDNFLASIDSGWLCYQEGVPEAIARPILSIRFNTGIDNVYRKLADLLDGDSAHVFMRPMTEQMEMKTIELDAAQQVIDRGLDGNLAKLCDPQSLTYKITKGLLDAESPKQELETMMNKAINEKGN